MSSTPPRSSFVAVAAAVLALGAVAMIALTERSEDVRIADLSRVFHARYRRWQLADGVRSPCPRIGNELNVALLKRYGLHYADAEKVIAVTGPPLAIYRHREYPAITYWQTDSYWITMAPGCQMLLPRNLQYDAMMALYLETESIETQRRRGR